MATDTRPTDRGAGDLEIVGLLRSPLEADRTRGIHLLLEKVAPSIAAMLRRRYDLAEEEIDEAIVSAAYQVWKRSDAFAPERGTLLALSRRIADNEAVNAIRRRRAPKDDLVRVIPLTAEIEAPEVQVPADHLSEQTRAICSALREIIAELPPMQRRIAEADLQHPECCVPARDLAIEIKTSPDAVYVHRSRYKETISRKMRSQGLMPS